jgi:hypothetical protein
MTPIKTLRENPHIEAYLADFLMVIAWGALFMCIGRATCAPRNAALAAHHVAALPSSRKVAENSASRPSTLPTESVQRAAYANATRAICFGFNFPGTVNTDTLIWFVASFFPATALLYSIFSIVTRLYEIEDSAQKTGSYYLYVTSPPSDAQPSPQPGNAAEGNVAPADPPPAKPTPQPAGWRDFQIYIRTRFREYYNPWEMAAFALSTGALVVVLAKLIVAKKYATSLGNPLDTGDLPIAFTAGAGMLGAASGAFLLILKRYRMFNIYPSTYLSIFVSITAGTFAGALWHFVFTPSVAIFLAFGIAFLTALNLEYFVDLLTRVVGKTTGQALAEQIPSDLTTVIQNPDALDVLKTMSLFSIAEFIRTDPMRLYLNLPQAIGTIDGWIDAALLRYFFPSQIDAFSASGVRQFSQLLHRFAERISRDGVKWRGITEIGAIQNVELPGVFETVKDVVENGRYYRQLGVIWDAYLSGRFSPELT